MLCSKLPTSIAAFFVCFIGISAFGQYESSSFTLTGLGAATPFARDYQALSINPANLDLKTGYEQKKTMGFFDFTSSIYTELLNKQQMVDGLTGKAKKKALTYEEQLAKVDELTMKPTAIDADLLTFGASIRTEKLGSFAFALRERFDFYSRIDRSLTELLWMGNQSSYFDSLVVLTSSGSDSTIARPDNIDPSQFNILSAFISSAQALSGRQIIGNSAIGFTWMREFNFGYGKRLIKTKDFEFHGGISAKYLMGQGIVELDGSQRTAFSSLSPFLSADYNLSEQAISNPSALSPDAPKFKPVGQGFGLDVGGTFIVKEHFIINAAINDIGEMRWDGNVYELGEGNVTEFDAAGIETLDPAEVLNPFDILGSLLIWKGEESRTTRLNTTTRFGVGFEQLQKLRIGFDVIAPMNDNKANLQEAAINAGIEFTPWPWLHLQTGFSDGGNYGRRMPAGIYFTAREGAYEMGIATRDLLTLLEDENPTISMALGFLRFRY
jgi:hypothetical protein